MFVCCVCSSAAFGQFGKLGKALDKAGAAVSQAQGVVDAVKPAVTEAEKSEPPRNAESPTKVEPGTVKTEDAPAVQDNRLTDVEEQIAKKHQRLLATMRQKTEVFFAEFSFLPLYFHHMSTGVSMDPRVLRFWKMQMLFENGTFDLGEKGEAAKQRILSALADNSLREDAARSLLERRIKEWGDTIPDEGKRRELLERVDKALQPVDVKDKTELRAIRTQAIKTLRADKAKFRETVLNEILWPCLKSKMSRDDSRPDLDYETLKGLKAVFLKTNAELIDANLTRLYESYQTYNEAALQKELYGIYEKHLSAVLPNDLFSALQTGELWGSRDLNVREDGSAYGTGLFGGVFLRRFRDFSVLRDGDRVENVLTDLVRTCNRWAGSNKTDVSNSMATVISRLAESNKLDYAKVNLYKTIESGQTLLEYVYANPGQISVDNRDGITARHRTGAQCFFVPVRSGFISSIWPTELLAVRVEFPESAGIAMGDLVGSLNSKYPGLKPVQSVPSGDGGELKTVRIEGFYELKSGKTLEVLESDDVRIELSGLGSKLTPVKIQEESLMYQLLLTKFIVETHPEPLVKEGFKPGLDMLEAAVKANDGSVPGLDTTLREQMRELQDRLVQQGMGELVLTARRKFRAAYANATPEGISLDVGQVKTPITMMVYDARRLKRVRDNLAEAKAASENLKKAAEDKRKKEALAL